MWLRSKEPNKCFSCRIWCYFWLGCPYRVQMCQMSISTRDQLFLNSAGTLSVYLSLYSTDWIIWPAWKGLVKCWLKCCTSALHGKTACGGDTAHSFSLHFAWSKEWFGALAGIPALNGELQEANLRHRPITSSFNTAIELWAWGCMGQCCNGGVVTGSLCDTVTKPAVCAEVLLLAKPVISVPSSPFPWRNWFVLR